MLKILAFAIAGVIGGCLGALGGEPVLWLAAKLPMLGTTGATALWTAAVSVALAAALVVAQNLYLQRAIISILQALTVFLAGGLTGAAAGAVGQLLYGFASSRFAEQAAAAPDLAKFGGWLILGGLLGLGMSFFIANLPRIRAIIAGALGGVAAAWLMLEVSRLNWGSELGFDVPGLLWHIDAAKLGMRVGGAAMLGLFIGATVAWVDTAFREAWLDILYVSDKVKRSVRLGQEPVTIGSGADCTVVVHGVAPVALRYRLERGNILCEDVPTGKTTAAKPGETRPLGKVTIQACAKGGATAAKTAPLVPKYVLRLSNGRLVDLPPDAKLSTSDFPGIDAPRGIAMAEVARNPQDPAVLGLKNLTDKPWNATLANGAERKVEPGRSLALAQGNRVALGGLKGEVLETFPVVNSGGGLLSTLVPAVAMLVVAGAITSRVWMVMAREAKVAESKPPPEVVEGRVDEPPEAPPEPPPIFDPPAIEPEPIDPEPRILVEYKPDGRFGVHTSTGNPADPTDDRKKLTYSTDGNTNNTRVWIDGATPLFGSPEGTLVRPMSKISENRYECEWEMNSVNVLQLVELTHGEASRRMDTVRVQYRLDNRGSTQRMAGLRIMLDTFIGANDGVPFIVPGTEGLVVAPCAFSGQEVPPFMEAIEGKDLSAPGVIEYIGLQPTGCEWPSQLVLSHWPSSTDWPRNVASWNYDRAREFGTDTAVGLYYEPKPLAGGSQRTLGFTFGLATIAAKKHAKLAIQTTGKFRSGDVFYVTALIQNPKPDQTVSLHLPAGLKIKDGLPASQNVPSLSNVYTQVTWPVEIDSGFFGDEKVVVKLEHKPAKGTADDPIEESQKVSVSPREARLVLRVDPPPLILHKEFWVSALVQNPRAGQTIELTLPEGLVLAKGHQSRQDIAPAAAGKKHSQINWRVRGAAVVSGRLKVKLSPDNVSDDVPVSVMEEGIVPLR